MVEYFLGIDVSKGYADFVLLDSDAHMLIQPFRLDDTSTGHRALQQQLQMVCKDRSDVAIYAAAESTGGLEQNWLQGLRRMREQLPLHVARVNPKGVAQYIKGNMTRTITDGVSAEMIARYLQVHRTKVRFDEPPHVLEPQRPVWSSLVLLKKQRAQLANTLVGLLYAAQPGIIVYCKRGLPQWVLSMIAVYPTSVQLSRARPATLARIPFISAERAATLIDVAKRDVASRTDEQVTGLIRTLVDQINHLDVSIEQLQKALIKSVAKNPQVELLCSFPGIGELSAVGLLMNLPDLKSVLDAPHLSSYWGLHPVSKSSGDGQTQPRMSKAGRAQARTILFMVAMSAVVHNPLIRAVYHRALKKGKSRMSGLGICMHKTARIVYGMLKSNRPFDAAIDEAYRARHTVRSMEQVRTANLLRMRRFQAHDATAPITKRETKKREALCGPHSADSTETEVTANASRKEKYVLEPCT